MSSSRHKLRLSEPLRDVRVRTNSEEMIPEAKYRQMLEDRYRQGFEAGQKLLGAQLVEQRKQLIEVQTGVLRSIEKTLPTVVAECERAVVLLALEAARRVVQDLPISGEAIEATVKAGLAELQETAEYEVRLHPNDLEMLEQLESGLLPGAANTQARFSADSTVPRGGCLIHTRHGLIEATREKMFEKLQAAVLC